jgi:hypothetical protein
MGFTRAEALEQFRAENRRFYIQRRGTGYLETVDEFTTKPEALAMLAEYRLSDKAGSYYISARPCKAWLTA